MANILVIDDDGIVRDALTVFLTRAGHQVTTAADGGNGIQAFKAGRPDLVILDRDLPVISGSGVFEKIREVSTDVPIMILTGYASPEEADIYIKHGAASFLSKGDGLSNVLAEVDRLLGVVKAPARPVIEPCSQRPPAPSGSGALILIADDDEGMLAVLVRSLRAEGYRVISAADGETAMRLARENKPDLVLLDISMPKKSGLEVLRELAPELPKTGFMMITGNEDEAVAKTCLETGAFDYIPKPMNLQALMKVIEARLLLQ